MKLIWIAVYSMHQIVSLLARGMLSKYIHLISYNSIIHELGSM